MSLDFLFNKYAYISDHSKKDKKTLDMIDLALGNTTGHF